MNKMISSNWSDNQNITLNGVEPTDHERGEYEAMLVLDNEGLDAALSMYYDCGPWRTSPGSPLYWWGFTKTIAYFFPETESQFV